VAVVGIGLIGLLAWMMRPADDTSVDVSGCEALAERSHTFAGDGTGLLERMPTANIITKLDDGWTGFLYTGRDTCPFCQQFTPRLANVVLELDMTGEIVYFDTDAAQNEAGRAVLFERLGIEFVPTFQFIRNGEIAGMLSGEATGSAVSICEFIKRHRDE